MGDFEPLKPMLELKHRFALEIIVRLEFAMLRYTAGVKAGVRVIIASNNSALVFQLTVECTEAFLDSEKWFQTVMNSAAWTTNSDPIHNSRTNSIYVLNIGG